MDECAAEVRKSRPVPRWVRRLGWWWRDHVIEAVASFIYHRLPDSGHGPTFKRKTYLFSELLWSICCGCSIRQSASSIWRLYRQGRRDA